MPGRSGGENTAAGRTGQPLQHKASQCDSQPPATAASPKQVMSLPTVSTHVKPLLAQISVAGPSPLGTACSAAVPLLPMAHDTDPAGPWIAHTWLRPAAIATMGCEATDSMPLPVTVALSANVGPLAPVLEPVDESEHTRVPTRAVPTCADHCAELAGNDHTDKVGAGLNQGGGS